MPDADKAAYFQAVFPGTPGYEHRVGAIVALHFAQLYVIWAIEMGALGNRRACSDSLKRADGYLDEVRHHLHDIIDRAEKRRPHPSLLLVRRYHAEHIAADSARLLKVWGEIHDILDAQDLENLKHNPTLAARCGLGHLIAPGEVVVKNRDSTFVHVPGEGTKGGAA